MSVILIKSPTRILTSPTLSLLGASLHTRPASYIPVPSLTSGGAADQSSNPLASLTRSVKTELSIPERELLALVGLILGLSAMTMMILCTSLSFSKASLTTRTTDDGKTLRKSSPEVGEAISRLLVAQDLWQLLAGIHVLVCSPLVAWIYLQGGQVELGPSTGLGLLTSDVVFTIAISDMLFWGYMYTVIKEEKRQVMEVREIRRVEDEEDETNRGEIR
ncbi:hypothetical protein PMZ80_006051 [Knufia obscura]|uniref:Uncharacterized protein n=1 Tax=Knufia obscura TaxID=1635080 RepID=A0ABR0RPC3_9EURO|nr:hypothetical protein PMZ80_006051 [Knufia obscura]